MVKGSKQRIKLRMVIVFGVSMALFLWAVGYLVQWQIVRGEELRTRAMDQSLRSTALTANRGTIYDATGTKVLAQSASVWTVTLEPAYIKTDADREKLADGLSRILDMDREEVLKKTQLKQYFAYLKRKIETEVKDEILQFLDDNKISRGVRMIEDFKRYYPYGSTASVVLGFTGTDNTGLLGVELEYENQLSGTTGRLVSAKNSINTDMPFQYEQMIPAQNGYDLVLTIDENVQSVVEKYLSEGVAKYAVKNGACAVVMDVKTGGIVALATADNFDLNDPFTIANEAVAAEIAALPQEEQDAAYNAAIYKQWRNKAVSDTYYPGSVFKMVTASMAIDHGDITPETAFYCGGDYTPIGGDKPIGCWIRGAGHGSGTVREGICNSCNPFFMQAAEAMGKETFFSYFEAFGMTKRTEVDLPGEADSLYHRLETMGPMDLAVEAFGQNFSITPLQMITAAAAVANGGYMVQPHVVDRILDSEGNIVKAADASYKRQVISTETSKLITEILNENATTGSGKNGNVPGYRVCGKTGTSEKVGKKAEDPTKPMEYIASYCGFAPMEDPKYALLVYLDEPASNASGGSQAAPIFAAIMQEILPYLGVESQLTASEFSESLTNSPNVIGKTIGEAKNMIAEKGLSAEVYGTGADEETVLMQIPGAGQEMPKDGKVVISTGETVKAEDLVTVPDFTGVDMASCNYIATQAGVQVKFTGATTTVGDLRAQNQSVPAGEKVKPGTVITLSIVDHSNVE